MNPEQTTADYDRQAHAHHWRPEALFGLVYEYLQPGDRLLDIGIGTGLASQTFARAGVQVFGFDVDREMLQVCRDKSFAADLKVYDLLDAPWPYQAASFEHALACGVLHFLADLEPIFAEVSRIVRPGGTFTFTTKAPPSSLAEVGADEEPAEETIQGTRLFLHPQGYLDRIMAASGFEPLKQLRLMVTTGRGTDDLFRAYVTRRLPSAATGDLPEARTP